MYYNLKRDIRIRNYIMLYIYTVYTSQFKIKIYKYQTDIDKPIVFKFDDKSIVDYNIIYTILESMILII